MARSANGELSVVTAGRRTMIACFGDREVEFVKFDEVADLLDDYGVEQVVPKPKAGGAPPSIKDADCVYLNMLDGDGVVHIHLACPQTACKPRNGATVIAVEKERLPKVVEHIIHLLNLDQLVLIPIGKWRRVFDAVAFSLASNEDWQEIDATATVELNTRDPLLCQPADYHTVIALISALVHDAESPDQGLMFLAIGSPVLVEVIPDGAVRISLGSQVLADELAEAFAS
jgi:hypothetical protein